MNEEINLQKTLIENEQLRKENQYLKRLLTKMMHNENVTEPNKIITKKSTMAEKLQLFKSLFKGRTDVYALRWESSNGSSGYTPACAFEWQKPICQKPQIRCSQCQNRKLLPLTDQVIYDHLSGKHVIGIYPMLSDGTCWFLAVDFDKRQWQQEVIAFLKTCVQLKVPYYVERSRSGNGAHVWIFFSSPVLAATARKLGMALLRKTKENFYAFELESFDRLFPNQDVLPKGGFGNLIALPLQKYPSQNGNSLFVDENFIPFPDQWMYLSTVQKMTVIDIERVLDLCNKERIFEQNELGYPGKIPIELKNGIHIKKDGVPPLLLLKIAEIASFKNPEFYKAQAKRFPTYGIPRTIQSVNDEQEALVLPRGCLEELLSFFEKESINVEIADHTYDGEKIDIKFHGTLSTQQIEVVNKLLEHNHGTLSATTGFGKTVVATAVIAERKRNTLIIVHRTQLMKQWVEQLAAFLQVSPNEIGQIGGGKSKITGKVDVATIQSLNYGDQLKSFITQYGQIIVDECHIISAITFESVLKQIRPKYMLGLTATPKRKDGMHPIITMQCGPIRYKIDAKHQAKVRPFNHRLITIKTNFKTSKTKLHEIYTEMAKDNKRNYQIFNDVLHALEEGRSPLILTERLEHLDILKSLFHGFAKNIIVLSGNMKKKVQTKELERLSSIPENEERIVISTGKFIGEGFDDARLDTLFLTMPISWKGTLQQYVGRLHRNYDRKEEVQVYDYVDEKVDVLKVMYKKRLAGYKSMGYMVDDGKQKFEQMQLF